MSFLEDKCSLIPVVTPEEMAGFTCGDHDLDEFFTNDCFAYSKELLGKTYCFKMDENSQTVVCAFTLANAGVRVSDLPNARKKKIEANIPHVKSLKDYPAVLVARLGVSKDFRSLHIGSDVLSYIKLWFLEPSLQGTGQCPGPGSYPAVGRHTDRFRSRITRRGRVPTQSHTLVTSVTPRVLTKLLFEHY